MLTNTIEVESRQAQAASWAALIGSRGLPRGNYSRSRIVEPAACRRGVSGYFPRRRRAASYAWHDLGHGMSDRRQSAMRNARLCKLLAGQGFDVVCATISLFHEVQRWNRENIPGYLVRFTSGSP